MLFYPYSWSHTFKVGICLYIYRDEPQGFNETPAFTPKSTWHPPKGHALLEFFLSQVQKEIFEIPSSNLKYSNMSREE